LQVLRGLQVPLARQVLRAQRGQLARRVPLALQDLPALKARLARPEQRVPSVRPARPV